MNVVLLTIDSLRADHCSCLGYDRETTPQLDSLCSSGTNFQNAYSVSSHTRESVPALLTGRYPYAAIDGNYRLTAPSAATRLRESHRTGGFHSNPFLSRAYGYDDGFDEFDDDLYLGRHRIFALAQRLWDKIRDHHYLRAESINDRSLSWIDSVSDSDSFFLWNHYMDVHGPYEPPEPYRSHFITSSLSNRKIRKLYQRALDHPDSITTDERDLLVDLYDGEVRYVDAMLGAFFDALGERDVLDETLLVVTSDHGDGLGNHGQYGHPRQLYPELVRVPFIAHGPTVPEMDISVPVSGVDWLSTVMRALGHPADQLDGMPLQELWNESSSPADRYVICEARGWKEASDRRRCAAYGRMEEYTYEWSQDENDRTRTLLEDGPAAIAVCRYLASRAEGSLPDDNEDASQMTTEISERLDALGYK